MIKVRLAPSPTGYLHIGTAQSALYNWLFAKSVGGEFHLRIEDTDKERSTKEFEKSILDALEWLGLNWDGEVVRQSERTERYRASLDKLLEEGKAFYCHHSKDELELERKSQEESKEAPRHICAHKNSELGKQAGGIIRLSVSGVEKDLSFKDQIRGDISFKSSLLGDFSIAKNLNEPLYNFAVVIDDSDMEITHVIRGEDHISNTPKQILIYEALNKKIPEFAHLPLILATDRSKLSKRHGAVAVVDYKKDYLSEALMNFLGALSYTFDREILTKEEMISQFQLSKVHKSGAAFDIKKLNWVNAQYIKKLSPQEFKSLVGLENLSDAAVSLITERLETLSEVETYSYLWTSPEYNKELLLWKTSSSEDVKNTLMETLAILDKSEFSDGVLRSSLDEFAQKIGNKGLVFWPLRAALSGRDKSPDPIQIALALGKTETVERVKKALTIL